MVKIGINGFGRIGKAVLRMATARDGVQVVGINEPLIDTEYLAYLLKYDSIYGKFSGRIDQGEGRLLVGNSEISVFGKVDPSEIPWSSCGAEYIIESSGEFTETEGASRHLKGGAKYVIVSASSKDIPMFSMGINNSKYAGEKVVAYAAPEVNALGAVLKVINENFGIKNGIVTCVNSLSSKQSTVDRVSRRDWRGGRAAQLSVIPGACGAVNGLGNIMPELKGLLSGIAMRVPTEAVSSVNPVCTLKKNTDYEQVKKTMKKASEENLRGILGFTEDSIVSCDVIGSRESAVFDARAGLLQDGNLLKITAWYDKEWGYAGKLLDFTEYISGNLRP